MSHDPAQTPNAAFPNLTPANHRVPSPADWLYNCVAWAVGDTARWWEPTDYWPDPAGQPGYDLANLIRVLEGVGYEACPDGVPEPGFQKIAVYADDASRYTYAARLLPNGAWTSKLGMSVDIEHDTPEDVAGGAYGELAGFMRRTIPAT